MIHSGRNSSLSVHDSLLLHSNVIVLSTQHFSFWLKLCTLRTDVFIRKHADTRAGHQSSIGDIFHRIFKRRKSASSVVYRTWHCAVIILSDNSIRGRTVSVKDPMKTPALSELDFDRREKYCEFSVRCV